ncbi:hypothetical protein CIW83_02810 [Tissierella sp. P1]|uniref:hypothetical protein n=1 Tax=Tissierella sp. P1 TaxID=1280483 RepID=UPI000BA142F6|nr:hypothetical protein [Tissierella sp. P1]OZV13493.1 hypothetical protein CIW83_02810 [Tissierella sp. P1]
MEIIIREKEDDLMLYYLDKGYRDLCNMKWGRKKIRLMREIFSFVKYNDSISEDKKEQIIRYLFHEIQKRAEAKKHSKRFLLYQINRYEDIYDLVKVFLDS